MPQPTDPLPLDLVAELDAVFRVCRAIVDEAAESHNPKLALLAAARVATLAELSAKLRGELREGAQVAIHMNPEFHALQSRLLSILAPHPELRGQVARALLTDGSDADR
ncbi:MAG: hypothetical protein JWM95_2414 [Gemmatimonadetes bacterium]|nr:hypothetical protein [Gemmatimonadota bacterium]